MNFGNKLKQLKYENLWAFIRSDVHAVRASIKLKGRRPLTTPGFFDTLRAAPIRRSPSNLLIILSIFGTAVFIIPFYITPYIWLILHKKQFLLVATICAIC